MKSMTWSRTGFSPLRSLREWLDARQVRDVRTARRLCKFIPAQCPFERRLTFRDRTLLHVPPLCKLNPVYDQLIGLRFRALCYLADECGEDISQYC
ncbi:MAG: Mo-dependent nitrogenase C-terminal domain-containing protein [Cyanobacteria bacterium P01_D01_bin.123]